VINLEIGDQALFYCVDVY